MFQPIDQIKPDFSLFIYKASVFYISDCVLYTSRWPEQPVGVIGVIKRCHRGLDVVLSSHMTGCDSQTALKQNKRQRQFAASTATVRTPARKLNARYSTQGSFK